MTGYQQVGALKVAPVLYNFIMDEALPGTNVDPEAFWHGFEALLTDLAPKNRDLLAVREALQIQINDWHKERKGKPIDLGEYKSFLEEIGYLAPRAGNSVIETTNVDAEIATIPGPQLVVPVMNARYALNAANARWGSLYDALYGTDAISEEGGANRGGGYNPTRGEKVIAFGRAFLDEATPLQNASHADAIGYAVKNGALIVTLKDGNETALADGASFLGYQGNAASPSAIVLKNNGLHVEISIDKDHQIGATD
ncbi:MAG: malate synthase G, partial [Pseudomonadota bacterium]